jgi:hypothetical protein
MADEVTEDAPKPEPKRYGVAMLHRRMVFRTGETRGDWVEVLIPYAGTELINPRQKFECITEHARPHLRKGLHYPGHFHQQWVAERNLS